MWPRTVFKKKDDSGRLLIRTYVEEIEKPGVYILYRGDELYYVGKSNRLISRLHSHANKTTDRYYPHWDYFSAFVLKGPAAKTKEKLAQLEAILIAAMPRAINKSTPRFARIEIPRALRKTDT